MTRVPARRVTAFALALAALLAGSGCGAFETPEIRPCGWLDRPGDTPGDGQDRPRTALLVDVSPSTRPDRDTGPDTPVPDWAATVLSQRAAALPELEGRDLSVAAFDGTRATVDWAVDRVSVPPVKGNDTLKKDRRSARRGCLEDRLRTLSAKDPGTGRTDLLGALAAAGEQLGPGGGRRVVVATDGLTNTGCADLRSAGFDGRDEIEAVVRHCREAGELPDLTGAEVSLVGLGRAARGAAPSSPQTAWLTALWERLCRATGASSCEVAARARTRPAAQLGGPAAATEPAVTFPAVSERPAGRIVTLTLPGSVLFATDRAELSSTARETLDRSARRIRELGALSVTVLGHTDSRGTEERGKRLSLARAQAVRAALRDRGIPVAGARGYSDDRPKCRPEYRDGLPHHAAMACNRRVEIDVTLRRR
ncbi:OmpA family protein [Streptomyces clavuligerus]|uniref:OmpA family protein n=1 Tax=Streptomyces clavuligerus TaxID=1901 RepID=UPI001013D2E0|nr:OmpA family protein [Streptomyces clavuligerus]MBY6301478.1 OmpA family protein [Streptomyces clavuligerus]QPL61762.1 OmpA family protein [Streptomyces clavuligerus]QPL79900.1 OmpA family protein [Streptomyces clavuligerus]QPL90259.1 OmpA family protein [Streptomyces clavuligerus]QPL92200.1 OmpA family protein [Streptomyces clavuligerus]